MRPIAYANSAERMKLMHRVYALAQPSNRHTNFDDVREVAHDGLGARSALVACHDAFERRVTVCQCCEKLGNCANSSTKRQLRRSERILRGLVAVSAMTQSGQRRIMASSSPR
jgi:hypothetical protein